MVCGLGACDRDPEPQTGPAAAPMPVAVGPRSNQADFQLSDLTEAFAYLAPPPGTTSTRPIGTVRFVQTNGKLSIDASVFGLSPGNHGFYIYEYGNVYDIPGGSLGEHYNPLGVVHGDTNKPGALGNIEARPYGNAVYTASFEGLSIAGDINPILGRAVVITEEPDTGQPNAGRNAKIVAVGQIVQMRPDVAERRRIEQERDNAQVREATTDTAR